MRGIGLALVLLLAPAVAGTWSAQTIQGGSTPELRSVAFQTPAQGLATGAGGAIVRTLDGGATPWTVQTSATTTALNGVGFGSATLACAVGDSGTIVRTTNADNGPGSTWASMSTGTLSAVAANSADNAWTAGSLALRKTTNHGTDWNPGDPGSGTVAVRGMSFLTAPTEGYWVGDMGTVMKTVDGDSWAPTLGATGTTNALHAVSMVKSGTPGAATGWVVGAGGVIRRTTNSGNAWTTVTVTPPVSDDLNGVHAGDATHAWAVGANGRIAAINGTPGWEAQTSPAGGNALNAVSMIFDAGAWKGVAVGANSTVVRTINGGGAWQPGTFGAPGITIRGVAMVTGTQAVAVGSGGTLRRTVDGGATWTAVGAGLTTEDLHAVSFGSATAGWAVGGRGTVLYTSDAGQTWSLQMTGTGNALKDVEFASPGVAIAVGSSATLLRSSNGGVQWVPLTNLDAGWLGRDLNSIAFGIATPNRAVAVGANGGVLVTNDQGNNWTTIAPSSPLPAPLVSVSALNATTFVAVGGGAAGAAVTISFDTTASAWTATVSSTPPGSGARGAAFAPYSRAGYAVGDGGAVFTTLDAGATWAAEASGTTQNLLAASFPYGAKGWAVGAAGTIRIREIAAPPLLSFPPHLGTPHTYQPPLIDGYVNPELSEDRRPDTGWNRALELTYADGTSQPPLKVQALRHNGGNSIYLSFEMRGDTGFDNDDTIVLLFRGDNPSPRPDHAANDRRIVISPLTTGTGAAAGAVVAPSGKVDSSNNPVPHVFPYATNRENGAPRALTSYRWNTGTNAWVAIPSSAEIDCKVRSWEPTGGDFCWSVEIKIPTVNTTYADWINIGTDFLFSFYTLRVQTGGVVEASWPRELAVSGPLDVVDAPFPAYDWGTAKLGTANDGQGVRIQAPYYQNIGVTRPASPTVWQRELSRTQLNTFHVNVANNSSSPAPDVRPTFRIADWGVQSGDPSSGAWRIVPGETGTPNPPAAQTIPANTGSTPVEFTFTWQMNSSQAADYAPPRQHQCILVTLDSTSNVDFTEASAWVNMDSVPASRFDRPATVSAKGFGHEGARNGRQRFYLHATADRFDYVPGKTALDVVAPPGEQDARSDRKVDHPYYSAENLRRKRLHEFFPNLKNEKTTASHYTWVIHAARESSNTVKINGTVYPILHQATGFGYVARHGDAVEKWTSGLSGAVVTKLKETEWRVDVPADGNAVIDSGLEAHEIGGCGRVLWLILLLTLFLFIIFWFLKKNP